MATGHELHPAATQTERRRTPKIVHLNDQKGCAISHGGVGEGGLTSHFRGTCPAVARDRVTS